MVSPQEMEKSTSYFVIFIKDRDYVIFLPKKSNYTLTKIAEHFITI